MVVHIQGAWSDVYRELRGFPGAKPFFSSVRELFWRNRSAAQHDSAYEPDLKASATFSHLAPKNDIVLTINSIAEPWTVDVGDDCDLEHVLGQYISKNIDVAKRPLRLAAPRQLRKLLDGRVPTYLLRADSDTVASLRVADDSDSGQVMRAHPLICVHDAGQGLQFGYELKERLPGYVMLGSLHGTQHMLSSNLSYPWSRSE